MATEEEAVSEWVKIPYDGLVEAVELPGSGPFRCQHVHEGQMTDHETDEEGRFAEPLRVEEGDLLIVHLWTEPVLRYEAFDEEPAL